MSYSFKPITDEELNANQIVENGVYDFEVIRSTRKTSKAGNPMAELNIRFWDKEGKIHTIFDYLVFSTINLNIRKVKHFCDATGLIEYYKKGEIPEDLGGYSGKFEIGYQDERPNPNGGYFPQKNIVVDYIKSYKKLDIKVDNDFINDSIPF